MTHQTTSQAVSPSLGKRIAIGAGIALALVIAFLASDKDPNPEWGKYYMVKPLIIVPMAGAVGGAISFYLDLRLRDGLQKVFATVFSFLIYIVGLWMGMVLGLNGTYWN